MKNRLAAAFLLALVFPLAGSAQTGYQVLHSFGGQTANDGSEPQCTLVSDGTRLYGTTSYGGYFDYGTVFSILPDGSDYAVLYHFGGETDPVAVPSGALVSDGSVLYGTARYGGYNGQGVVFSLETDGTGYTELHSFAASTGDGLSPIAGVTGDGTTLYGTTAWGGEEMWGTVFSLEPNVSGATVIHSFPAFPEDGDWPYAAPLLDNGVLYGTTLRGPVPENTPYPPVSDAGVVYSLQTDGSSYSLLYTFGSQKYDGEGPVGTLLSDGTLLYGITAYGGAADYGTVFSLDPNASSATVLHSFTLFTGDGMLPTGGLVSDGTRLYGTTTAGGSAGGGYYYGGTIFALNPDGSGYTVLHDFSLQTENGYWLLFSGLLLVDHTLYGAASRGGDHDYGVIFSYTLPSPTPTPTVPPTPTPTCTVGPPTVTPEPTPPSALSFPMVVWEPSTGKWVINFGSGSSPEVYYFGKTGDVPAAGDFNGDGSIDPAIFRPQSGLWAIRGLTRFFYGRSGDQPVRGDYQGTGTDQVGVYRPSSGLWAIRGVTRIYYGRLGDQPVSADYRGTGTDQVGIYRSASGLWAIRGVTRIYYGRPDDRPVPGDYAGTGTAQVGIYRSASGLWAIQGVTRLYYGRSGDIPVPGDYPGNGFAVPAIYRSEAGIWAVRDWTTVYWGGGNFIPVCW